MSYKKKPEINEELMGKNPFMTNIQIKARSFDKSSTLIKHEDGVNLPTGTVRNTMLVEEQSYTKIYHDTDYRDIILGLSEKATKLYLYITYRVNSNEDYVWLNNIHFQELMKYKKRQYVECVHELVRYGIITPTIYPETYFINPLIFFCGNRLKKYPENVKLRGYDS